MDILLVRLAGWRKKKRGFFEGNGERSNSQRPILVTLCEKFMPAASSKDLSRTGAAGGFGVMVYQHRYSEL